MKATTTRTLCSRTLPRPPPTPLLAAEGRGALTFAASGAGDSSAGGNTVIGSGPAGGAGDVGCTSGAGAVPLAAPGAAAVALAQAAVHSASVANLLPFPAHPPHVNNWQAAAVVLKCQRCMAARQGPPSGGSEHCAACAAAVGSGDGDAGGTSAAAGLISTVPGLSTGGKAVPAAGSAVLVLASGTDVPPVAAVLVPAPPFCLLPFVKPVAVVLLLFVSVALARGAVLGVVVPAAVLRCPGSPETGKRVTC